MNKSGIISLLIYMQYKMQIIVPLFSLTALFLSSKIHLRADISTCSHPNQQLNWALRIHCYLLMQNVTWNPNIFHLNNSDCLLYKCKNQHTEVNRITLLFIYRLFPSIYLNNESSRRMTRCDKYFVSIIYICGILHVLFQKFIHISHDPWQSSSGAQRPQNANVHIWVCCELSKLCVVKTVSCASMH